MHVLTSGYARSTRRACRAGAWCYVHAGFAVPRLLRLWPPLWDKHDTEATRVGAVSASASWLNDTHATLASVAKQNIYDDPTFFAGYRDLRDNSVGLHENLVLPMLPAILPELTGKRVIDLGCGDGFFCRLARAGGAAAVLGIDPSEKMHDLARERTRDAGIEYLRAFAEDADLPDESADIVVSILALHYVADFKGAVGRIARWLVADGVFVLVVEHPVFTAPQPPAEFAVESGTEKVWPLSHYFDEGKREHEWYVSGVVKYHRRLETIVNAIIDAGLTIERLAEPSPTREAVEQHPRSRGELIRPALLAVRARKHSGRADSA